MEDERDIWEMEAQFWHGDASFYQRHLADDCLMVFPEPTGILDRSQVLAAITDSPRWESVRFEAERSLWPNTETTIIAYKAIAAQSAGTTDYAALCSSAYVLLQGAWTLAFHQQTPTEAD